jgi:hypothetical protein
MVNKVKYLLLLGIVFNLFSLLGQNDIIDVIGKGSREVEPASRILEFPKIIDTIKPTNVPSYPMLVFRQPTKIELDTIDAATVETTEKLKPLYPFYAKVGVGSTIMPMGELYFNSTRSRNNLYGFNVKHLSSFGDVKNRKKVIYAPAQFDRTNLNAFGKIIESNYTLSGNLNYQNNGFHYYGIPIDSISADSISQRINQVGGDFEFIANRGDTSKLNLMFGTGYNYLTTKKPLTDSLSDWKTQEHNFHFNTKGWYNFKTETFYAKLGVRYNGYRYGIRDSVLSAIDSGLVSNNTIIDFQPGVLTQMFNDKLKAEVGLTLSIDIHDKTKAYVFPQAEFKYSLFNDIFIPFAGIRGGLKQTSYRSLSTENQFVLVNIPLANESTPFDIYGGFKGTITKKLSFNLNASFAKVMNKAFFVTDTLYSVGNKFGVVYDTMNLTKVEGSLAYQLNEKIKIDAIARYFSYETKNQAFAWNLPIFQFVLRGSYNLFDKFLVNLDANLEGGRKALVYGPGENIFIENNQYYQNLGFIADVNLGLEYRYNKRISAFLQVNNLASQRYYRWYNYPVQPIQVMGGITARF